MAFVEIREQSFPAHWLQLIILRKFIFTHSDQVRGAITQDVRDYTSGNNDEYFDRLQRRFLGQNYLSPALSCAEILQVFPNSQSGYYWVGSIQVYCDFDLSVASPSRAWERVMSLDLANRNRRCPSENLRLIQPPEAAIRYCVKSTNVDGCSGFVIPVGTDQISRVFGRVQGIQIGTVDGLNNNRMLNEAYLDGVSITVGQPREHVWSFIAYTTESSPGCPCSVGSSIIAPAFVGNDSFCESATPLGPLQISNTQNFVNDILWDGLQCGGLEQTCCGETVAGISPPWFLKELNQTRSSGGLEVRLCTDGDTDDKNVGLQLIELYVQ